MVSGIRIWGVIDHHLLYGATIDRHFSHTFLESAISASIPMTSNTSTRTMEERKRQTAGLMTCIIAYWLSTVCQATLIVVRLCEVLGV